MGREELQGGGGDPGRESEGREGGLKERRKSWRGQWAGGSMPAGKDR